MFSPLELIAEARLNGSQYPESTLRTLIVGAMCVNAPDNHAVQYRDLERVGRGAYRLVDGRPEGAFDRGTDSSAATEPASAPDPSAPPPGERDWYWESNVQAAVVTYLAATGWSVNRVADTATRESGVDIAARRGSDRILVEVKGYPSATYARGDKIGLRKPTNRPTQARQYFAGAVLTGLLLRGADSDSRVALAFPDFETYRSLARRVGPTLAIAVIELWLVGADGAIQEP